MEMSEDEGWSTDFAALKASPRYPVMVYATCDDGYGYGLAGWLHPGKGEEPVLVWGDKPHHPINDGIERALCWKHIEGPSMTFLDAALAALTASTPADQATVPSPEEG